MGETIETGTSMARAFIRVSKAPSHTLPQETAVFICLARNSAIISIKTRLCLSTGSVLFAGEVLIFSGERAGSTATLLLHDFLRIKQRKNSSSKDRGCVASKSP